MMFNGILEKYNILESEVSKNGETFVITKLNWPYDQALNCQNDLNSYIYENPQYRVFIITSHPRVLTMGRGLQRGMVDKHNLIEFDENLSQHIPVEVYNVKRGGGLTFHHPGQIVIYPIVHIAEQKIKTIELMNSIFQIAKETLENNSELDQLEYDRPLLGLWQDEHKVASMGIQLIKFVSLHGLAINILKDDTISNVLKTVYPCGLSGMVYKSVSEFGTVNYDNLIKEFKSRFLSINFN